MRPQSKIGSIPTTNEIDYRLDLLAEHSDPKVLQDAASGRIPQDATQRQKEVQEVVASLCTVTSKHFKSLAQSHGALVQAELTDRCAVPRQLSTCGMSLERQN